MYKYIVELPNHVRRNNRKCELKRLNKIAALLSNCKRKAKQNLK